MEAKTWIEYLELEPHSEGGFFKQTFHSETTMETEEENTRFLYTSIYFLLRSEDRSHFHRLKSDELWYFHAGSPLTIHIITPDGKYEAKKLGLNVEKGEEPQILVPKNTIFGSTVDEPGTFSLVGCMVSPGFDYKDFELFTQQELLDQYPEHESIIRFLAYETLPGKE